MSRALRLARRGEYTTHPNPRVGCVIVRDEEIIGEGWHQFRGSAHAEINALEALKGEARDSTCYVSLEPCNHQGHTGPCSEALVEAGVGKVIAAMLDPNPQVAGEGLQRLKQAGIKTAVGLLEEEARKLNAGFVMRMTHGRPYIRCKMAMSLDGRTAMSSGESKWISGPAARTDVQKLRARSAAIMTGVETVLHDDPGLNIRDIETGGRQPLRVILDRQLRMPAAAKMLSLPGRSLVFTQEDNLERKQELGAAGAEVVLIESGDFLAAIMSYLAQEEEVNEVLVEAGATLSGALVEASMLDELIIYQAPVILGDSARPLFQLPALKTMQDKIQFDVLDSRSVGGDRRTIYKVKN